MTVDLTNGVGHGGAAEGDTYNFIGAHGFDHHRDEVNFVRAGKGANAHVTLQVDLNGDGHADMQIVLQHVHNLHASDLILSD